MTRMRLTLDRLEALAAQLSDNDLSIVATLSKLRLATAIQLERLHFREGSALTQARRARRSLERLTGLGVLIRLDRRIGGVRSGSAGFVYALGVAGQRLNGGRGPAGGRRIQRPWTPSIPFVAHILAVTELFVRLIEAEREGLVELLSFAAEPASWRRFVGPTGSSVTIKPDAHALVGQGDDELHFFIEVDRGTEGRATIAAKLRLYQQYWASGREQHQWGVFPGVLLMVPDHRRAQVITAECSRMPAHTWELFQTVVWDQAVAVMTGQLS
jgi:hypothetical protein